MRRNDHLLRTLACGLLAAVTAALAGSVAQGQSGITVTFPARVVAAPDYATDVLGDAWDMCNSQDISPFPQERVGFSSFNFSTSPCKAGGAISAADATVTFLYRGIYPAVDPGRNGRNFPIDPTKYQVISYKLESTRASEFPQIYWFNNSYQEGPNDLGRINGAATVNGTQIVVAPLNQTAIEGTNWGSRPLVRGLRIDPNSGNSGYNAFFHWVRLTPASGAVQRITWSGGSGTATITVRDSGGTTFPITSVPSASFYDWNYGVLPPGSYTLTVTKPGSSGSTTFTINHPPTIQVTDPSPTTGQDFATSVRGNPWDMSDSGDVILTGSEHTTAVSFSGGQAHATNTTNDPNVTLNRTVSIDTTKYRYLTYRFQVDGAFDLTSVGGSVARVFWGTQGSLGANNTTTSTDILVWPGMNSYTVDLASLSTAPGGGLVNNGGGLWAASPKLSLRFDPHEGTAQRAFHIDDVKLTAKPAASGSFTIRFAGSDADGDATTVSLYSDNDTNAANGKTLIASGIPIGAGLFGWNTNGKPQGDYYIYAEANDGIQTMGRYSTVPIQVSATTAPLAARRGDFDGDRKTDLTVFRPSNGNWLTKQSSSGYTTWDIHQWAVSGDIPVPGDYDGDGRTDIAVYRPSNGSWYLLTSSTNFTSSTSIQWGMNGDVPMPGDYDGDGRTDPAVYRPSNGSWYLLKSSTNFVSWTIIQWGSTGDVPMPGDYDGDRKTDPAVYRPSNGSWYLLPSSTNYTSWIIKQWGLSGDIPMPGDYDGDGKTDMAVYRPSNGSWYILRSSTNSTAWTIHQWGLSGDEPTPGDYDGDGKTDPAVYRPSNGTWYLLQSSTNFASWTIIQWGTNGDRPVVQK